MLGSKASFLGFDSHKGSRIIKQLAVACESHFHHFEQPRHQAYSQSQHTALLSPFADLPSLIKLGAGERFAIGIRSPGNQNATVLKECRCVTYARIPKVPGRGERAGAGIK